ncbi:MAG TPA: glycosyltransferase family 2 protein [Xanthobacteraceae bacterium]|nr:glycosyltransferase family 2 protein [Xanthobacteraceae bacterium]
MAQASASQPLVSVVVTAYNSAPTILRAMESVLAQTMPDLELIVVDDASTDDTAALAESIYDGRVRLIRNARNRGIGGAKNVGVAAALGRYVAFLDSDDTWEPHKLAMQLAALQPREADAPLSFTGFWVHRDNGERSVLRQPHKRGTWLRTILTGETFSLGSTLLVTKQCFETVGPFEETLRRLQDRDWTLRYLRQWSEFVFVPEPLSHIHNSGWPKAATVATAVDDLYRAHEVSLKARDPALASLFRNSLDFEVAVSEYRTGQRASALRRVVRIAAAQPSFTGYLAYRACRKLVQRDLA